MVRNRSFKFIFSALISCAAVIVASGLSANASQPRRFQQTSNPQIAPPLPQQPPLAIPQAPPHPTLAVIVLDAAHGGPDAGARGASGINESDITIEFARNIKPALEAQGFRVVETREENENPTFDERSAIANAQRGAVFVTLHVSSTGIPGQVRVYSNEGSAEPSRAFTTSDAAKAGAPAPDGAIPMGLPVPQTNPVTPGINLGAGAFPARNGMLPWDRAQENYTAVSRRFAELVQLQFSQHFAGNSTSPYTAAVRQLRTVAAPAIAVEVSSVSVNSRAQLTQMSHDLADAIARGVVAFKPVYEAGAR